jgi:hypothetical protein
MPLIPWTCLMSTTGPTAGPHRLLATVLLSTDPHLACSCHSQGWSQSIWEQQARAGVKNKGPRTNWFPEGPQELAQTASA